MGEKVGMIANLSFGLPAQLATLPGWVRRWTRPSTRSSAVAVANPSQSTSSIDSVLGTLWSERTLSYETSSELGADRSRGRDSAPGNPGGFRVESLSRWLETAKAPGPGVSQRRLYS